MDDAVYYNIIAGSLILLMGIYAFSLEARRKKKILQAGYEQTGNKFFHSPFYTKDGNVFLIPGAYPKLKNAAPIEIVGINEITRNSKLVQLEIRYRTSSAIKSMNIAGSPDNLLTLADKLGYGG